MRPRRATVNDDDDDDDGSGSSSDGSGDATLRRCDELTTTPLTAGARRDVAKRYDTRYRRTHAGTNTTHKTQGTGTLGTEMAICCPGLSHSDVETNTPRSQNYTETVCKCELQQQWQQQQWQQRQPPPQLKPSRDRQTKNRPNIQRDHNIRAEPEHSIYSTVYLW
ncbi:GH13173 [Drosophila grimshawi]|uniref:GH13173 n=1 Tax=Drosophila grimshawi TaxID=7222 RepID=B4JQJ3_DROGR|nr:GH13173 [Drosophila grimshawi]